MLELLVAFKLCNFLKQFLMILGDHLVLTFLQGNLIPLSQSNFFILHNGFIKFLPDFVQKERLNDFIQIIFTAGAEIIIEIVGGIFVPIYGGNNIDTVYVVTQFFASEYLFVNVAKSCRRWYRLF